MFQNLLYRPTFFKPWFTKIMFVSCLSSDESDFFSFVVYEHIILSVKGGDVRKTYLLTEHKMATSKEKKLIYVLRWDLIFYQSDWRYIWTK